MKNAAPTYVESRISELGDSTQRAEALTQAKRMDLDQEVHRQMELREKLMEIELLAQQEEAAEQENRETERKIEAVAER